MMEKIKAKFAEAKQWFSKRFDLDSKFGVVVADAELSARVVGKKIGETAKNFGAAVKTEWSEFRESPKEYVKSRWESFTDKLKTGKEKLIGKFEEIKTNLKENNKVAEPFEDRFYSWYKKQSENIFRVEAKITENRMAFELKKIKLTLGDTKKESVRNLIANRIKELKEKRDMFIEKAEKQKTIGFIFQNEILAFA